MAGRHARRVLMWKKCQLLFLFLAAETQEGQEEGGGRPAGG